MAIVKCRECGADVSTKAKSCPNCGAKAPRKTSRTTWLILSLIVLVVVFTAFGDKTEEVQTAAVAVEVSSEVPEPASWRVSDKTDQMDGSKSFYASSPRAIYVGEMGFPYGGTQSWLGVGCSKRNEWVYLGFSVKPNLSRTTTKSGYDELQARIRWDETLETVSLTQDWQSEFLHFVADSVAIEKISKHSLAILELQWYGEQPVMFPYSLRGSSKAISEIRASCANL